MYKHKSVIFYMLKITLTRTSVIIKNFLFNKLLFFFKFKFNEFFDYRMKPFVTSYKFGILVKILF